VSAALGTLEVDRVALRRRLQTLGPRPPARSLASRIARALAATSSTLASLQPPPAVSQAQATLATALQRASGAYTTLAGAAGAADTGGYTTARTQVYAAESGVQMALRSFALLGYGGG
jgi:hypothetical protein